MYFSIQCLLMSFGILVMLFDFDSSTACCQETEIPRDVHSSDGNPKNVVDDTYAVSGVVFDSENRAVEGAVVSVADDLYKCDPPTLTTKTNASGEFLLKGVTTKKPKIRVVAKDGSTCALDKVSLGPDAYNQFQTEPSHPLILKIVDRDEQPVEGAEVILGAWNRSGAIPWSGRTDAKGVAVWPTAPHGELAFVVHKPGLRTSWDIFQIEADVERTIKLYEPYQIEVRVIDQKTRNPVPKYRVTPQLERAFRARFPFERLLQTNPPLDNDWRIDVAHGSFTASTESHFDSLCFRIQARGYEPLTTASILPHSTLSVQQYELVPLTPEETVPILVRGIDEKPASEVNVTVFRPGTAGVSFDKEKNAEEPHNSNCQRYVSDDLGVLRLDQSRLRNQAIVAWNESGWYFGDIADVATEIQLRPYVKGRFRLPSRGQSHVSLVIRLSTTIKFNADTTDCEAWFPIEQRKLPGQDFEFIGNHIPTEKISLIDIAGFGNSRPFVTLDAEEGKDVYVDLRGTGKITGRLVVPEAAPFRTTGLQITATCENSDSGMTFTYEAKVHADGKFELTDLISGDYVLDIPDVNVNEDSPLDENERQFFKPIIKARVSLDDDEEYDVGDLNVRWTR